MSGLAVEQVEFFARAKRVYGAGHLSAAIQAAEQALIARNSGVEEEDAG